MWYGMQVVMYGLVGGTAGPPEPMSPKPPNVESEIVLPIRCAEGRVVGIVDLEFRLSQDFASSVGVKKELLTVPVRKPSKEWFIQTHPEESYRMQTAVLELKEDRETYLIAPELCVGRKALNSRFVISFAPM